ncbi:MAG: hypothetical protein ACXWWC_14655 [Chitinophagaceae bacterium]
MKKTYISYVIQTIDGPVFDHVKIQLDHTFSSGTFHDITQNGVVTWADRKMSELPEGQRLTVLNFFTFEYDK